MCEAPTTRRGRPGPVLLGTGIVAILRGGTGEHLDAVAGALVRAGLRCLEITTNTPGGLAAVRDLRAAYGGRVELGVGTVRTPAQVDAAADAGATFVVSPCTDCAVGDRAADRGLAWYPGALTPTEIAAAWDRGAAAVKVFPAGPVGGPRYLRQVLAPLDDIPLVPTGGVAVADVAAYLRAGAPAVGLGSALIGDALAGGDLGGLAERAAAARAAVASVRGTGLETA